ncbi:MAG: hypothetical protein CMM74_12900, partial [Rhodospirillaceae bacterium]|nr:hypothetical protein [Rhodospirillaceae bacterium]
IYFVTLAAHGAVQVLGATRVRPFMAVLLIAELIAGGDHHGCVNTFCVGPYALEDVRKTNPQGVVTD